MPLKKISIIYLNRKLPSSSLIRAEKKKNYELPSGLKINPSPRLFCETYKLIIVESVYIVT